MEKYKNFRKYNLWAGLLHLLSGSLMVFLSNDFKLPINTSFIQFDVVTETLSTNIEKVFDVQFGYLVASFLFMSAIAHFIIASPWYYEKYIANLKKGLNPARWVEYSFSSSLMIVAISMLTGIYDVVTLLVLFFLNATMIWFGWMMELHNQTTEKTDWTSFVFGSVAGLIPWIGVALFLFGSGEGEYQPPTFVYWVFFSMFFFFNIFAVNMYLQYKQIGKWKDYTYGEKSYIVLSLVAKSLLAWIVFAGTLRPE